jgi:hypothetical protein
MMCVCVRDYGVWMKPGCAAVDREEEAAGRMGRSRGENGHRDGGG